MSAKKKQPLIICDKCGCAIQGKDGGRHAEFCGKPLDQWEIPLIRPKAALKGFLTHVDKVAEFLPPDAVGWTRGHAVLLNPQTMEVLRATARQPVRVSVRGTTLIGTVWPCKEVPSYKVCVTARDMPKEKLCQVELLWEYQTVPRLEVSIGNHSQKDVPLREYLEMYLSNSFVEPGVAVLVQYYGKTLKVVPEMPLESSLQNMSLGEGEIESSPVLHVKSDCSVSVVDCDTQSEEGEAAGDCASADFFAGIGGMYEVKRTLLENVVTPFRRDGSCCSVLLWGLPGSGKTKLLRAVARMLGAAAFYLQSMDELLERGPLIPKGGVAILDFPSIDKEHKAFRELARLLEGTATSAVILSVRQADDLELGVRVRFPVEVEVSVPTEKERIEILSILLAAPLDDDVIVEQAKRTHGFTAGDLNSLATASRFASGDSQATRMENARRRVRPTGIRQFILEVPDVKWNDIGGNEELKLEIQQAVIWPQQHRGAFERFGIDPPAGILLYGPPGCSKTLVARALANESKMNFLAVKGPELFSKWVGDSEKAIRELFARARQVAPTIVFFDEIDAVGASRGSDKSSGVSDRVLAQLLTELDGLEKSSDVIMLAATNRPDQLDSALLRPGRLDRSIYVGLPTASTRRAILTMRTRKMTLHDDVHLETLVDKTEGYSGAELVAVCRNAALVAMREDINASSVHWNHFETTLTAIVPRTEKYLLDIYHQFQLGCIS